MMKPLFVASVLVLVCSSCSSVDLADQGVLNRTAMKFDARGARSAECSLVSQVEKGRSLTNSSAGGGCASCQ